MQYRKMVVVTLLALVLSYANAAFSTSTIATHSDPVVSIPPALFTYTDTSSNATIDGTLTGGFSGLGLTLIFPVLGFTAFTDATFTITPTIASPVLGDPDGLRLLPVGGVGTVEFFDSAATLLLSIEFNQLHRTTGVIGASDLVPGESVTITLPGGPVLQAPESFFWSLANVEGDTAAALAGNSATVEATAALTSSADIATAIPEPSTVALLGVGLIGLGLRQGMRRTVKARLI